MTITAYPLAWPAIRPRTGQYRRERAKFRTAFAPARDDLHNELRLLGARNVVISSNVPLRQDGLPYARYPEPTDPGVAVYFELQGEARCIAIDKWNAVKDNLKAIQKTIEAIRGIERWGDAEMMYAAFQGFQALPESANGGTAWWDVLEVPHTAKTAEIEAAYRRLARVRHPDVGGSTEAFHQLQEARDRALSQVMRREAGLTV